MYDWLIEFLTWLSFIERKRKWLQNKRGEQRKEEFKKFAWNNKIEYTEIHEKKQQRHADGRLKYVDDNALSSSRIHV